MNEGRESPPENLNNLSETTSPKEEEDIPPSFKGREDKWREFIARRDFKKELERRLDEIKDKYNRLIPLWDDQEKISQKPDGMKHFKSLYDEFLGMHDKLYEHGGFGKKLKEGSPIAAAFDYLSMEELKEIERQLEEFEPSLADLEDRLRKIIS